MIGKEGMQRDTVLLQVVRALGCLCFSLRAANGDSQERSEDEKH
jgi:hypothetical protein